MYKIPLVTLLYGIAFHCAYIVEINPLFDYAGYYYFPPTNISLLATYIFIVAPIVAYRPDLAPSSIGAAIIFTICYVPAQLIILFNWQRMNGELFVMQALLAASMAIILRLSGLGAVVTREVDITSNRLISMAVRILTILSLAIFIYSYKDNIRFVSFDDVYDLRFETNKADKGHLVNYMTSWLIYCFIPFYFARGICQSNRNDILLALGGSILIYATMGSKASILLGLIMLGLFFLLKTGEGYFYILLVSLTCSIILSIAFLPNDGALFYLKSIFLVRVLSAGGWGMSNYYEYFSNFGFTYYSHIRIIDFLFNAYSYGDYSLGQLIGLQYTGDVEANFNANFWASDAFAAMGLVGVPIITAALCGFLYLINRSAVGYRRNFVTLWLVGFWLALLNVPFSVALLSGGGLLTMFLLWMDSPRRSAFSTAIK